MFKVILYDFCPEQFAQKFREVVDEAKAGGLKLVSARTFVDIRRRESPHSHCKAPCNVSWRDCPKGSASTTEIFFG